jgi:hypothetical protein
MGFISFEADKLRFYTTNTAVTAAEEQNTNAVFRDPSAWYHVVVAVDTTQATYANRVLMYVNGVAQAVTVTNQNTQIAQNALLHVNRTEAHNIGRSVYSANQHFDGYLTEINFIDGQALDPSSFGDTNTITGVWQPKRYSGTYGTNGFYLNFSDNSAATAAAIGKDSSGNGNNWTPNNISVTAGATYDSMLDSPTQFGDGGNGRGNYCVLNPLTLAGSGTGTVTDGNLRLTSPSSSSTAAQVAGSIAPQSGRFYFESTFTTLTNASGNSCIGIQDASVRISGLSGTSRPGTNTWWISDDGNFRSNGGTITSSGLGSFSAGDIAMIAIDVDTGKAWIGKNGTWIGDPAAGTGNTFSSLPALIAPMVYASINTATSSVITANFGQRPFSYTPPSGFKALNTLNLPAPTISNGATVMAATLYTGNATARTIDNSVNGVSFQPDLVWIKSRSATTNNQLVDSVRGVSLGLSSNLTSAEYGVGVNAFASNGFGLATDGSLLGVNVNAQTYVAWQWKKGPTQGFDIVTYTGTGVARTVAHSLGVAPSMMIVKGRNSTPDNWRVWHSNLISAAYTLGLNQTIAQTDIAGDEPWNNTAPTSSVFSIGTDVSVNENTKDFVAYLWSEVAGFSRFGSYTGNGSADGPFVFCGFRPAFVMIKGSSFVSNWFVIDASRSAYNVSLDALRPNLDGAEVSSPTTTYSIDILSNGFKLRTNAADSNTNAATFIFAAFAEHPFKNALAR